MSLILPPTRTVLSGRTRIRELVFPIPAGDFELIQTVSSNPSSAPTYAITWSHDGLHLIRATDGSNLIYSGIMSTAYDISTQTSFISSNISANWTGIAFNDDGLQITTITTGDSFQEYTLSSPYDVSTMVSTGNSKFIGSGFHSSPVFSSDGLRLWHLSSTSIREWTFGTPYDLSTISASPVATLDLTPFHASFSGWSFSLDGSLIYLVVGSGSRQLASLTLGTPFDITSIAGSPVTNQYDDSGLALSTWAIPRGLTINPNNGNLTFIQDQNARLIVEIGRP